MPLERQRAMRRAEVVDRASEVGAPVQRLGLPRQGAAAAYQGAEPGAEGGVEPFDPSGIDDALAEAHRHRLRRAEDNLAGDAPQTLSVGSVLDHLGHCQPGPETQRRATPAASALRVAKDPPYGGDLGCPAIHTPDQALADLATAAHQLCQRDGQGSIPLHAYHRSQPQATGHRERHRDPDDPALPLDAQLIGLHLRPRVGPLDQRLLELLTVAARALLPGGHRALVKVKGGDNGGWGTAVRQQGHDL